MHQFSTRTVRGACLIAACIPLIILWAQSAQAAMPPVYDVELVIFTNESSSDGGENWNNPDPGAIRPTGFFPEDQFTELASAYYSLNNISRALERSGRHTVLFHRAWRQLAYNKANAVAYPVHSIAENRRDSIEGVIKLVRERFLHLDVNLQLMTAIDGTEVMFSDAPNSRPAFELIESRRINSNVLHYFDHPRFGLIARVTPFISKKTGGSAEEEAVEILPDENAPPELPNPADDQLTR